MLSMVKGCKVQDPSILFENYARTDTGYIANVHAEKIADVMKHFIDLQDDYVFLFLEIPSHIDTETEIEPGVVDCFHSDVFYLDGFTKENAKHFLDQFGELFIHDGMCIFGFGAHAGGNEIKLGQYNVVSIYTKTPNRYEEFFEKHDISEVENLITAWEYFTHETAGECFRYEYRGKDIYDIVDYLKDYGLYFAERREQ